MKTEREMFLYELNGHGYHFKNTDWHDDWERFEDDQLNMVWEMWYASASREGYKLVPCEPTKAMQQSAFDVYEVCDYKNYHLNSGTEVRDMIYKAMIGAAS